MSFIELSVGCTWDENQLNFIDRLNDQYSHNRVRVAELYGSLRTRYAPLPSARPDFRLPDIDFNSFQRHVEKARKISVDINYTCNATMHCSVDALYTKRGEIKEFFRRLEDAGVARLTVSNPLLIEMACNSCSLPIDISTIMHPSYPSQIPMYASWRADRVCLDIYRNRDIATLRKYALVAGNHGIAPVLITNEFCMFGSAPCHGILRQACYEHSSLGGNPSKRFADWPFERCHTARMNAPHSWLQAGFILPQHLDTYAQLTGIRHFKVTGRTFTTQHVNSITNHYLAKTFTGPLPLLWIDPGKPTTQDILSKFDITAAELESIGFFSRWFEQCLACDYSCDVGCNYCATQFINVMQQRKEAK